VCGEQAEELATFRVWEKVPEGNVLSYESTLRSLSTQCSEGTGGFKEGPGWATPPPRAVAQSKMLWLLCSK